MKKLKITLVLTFAIIVSLAWLILPAQADLTDDYKESCVRTLKESVRKIDGDKHLTLLWRIHTMMVMEKFELSNAEEAQIEIFRALVKLCIDEKRELKELGASL